MLETPLLSNPGVKSYAVFHNSFFDTAFETSEPDVLVMPFSMNYYNFINFVKIMGAAVGKVSKAGVFNDAVSEFYEILREEVVGAVIRNFWEKMQEDGDVGPCAEFYDACKTHHVTLHDLLQLTYHKCLEKIDYMGDRDSARVFEDFMRDTATTCEIRGSQSITPRVWELRFFNSTASNLFFALPASAPLFEKVLKPALIRFSESFSD